MKYIDKWKEKSLWSKITDFIFIAFIIALIIPQSRLAIGGFVNNIKSMIIEPKIASSEDATSLPTATYSWQFADIENNTHVFNDFKGKVVFLNFWATWCPPCVGEMPQIQSLYDEFKDNEDVKFILVSNEKLAKIKAFIEYRKYTFPVYSSRTKTPSIFYSESIPTSFLISKSGKIIIKEKGAANWGGKKMIETVNKLLKE